MNYDTLDKDSQWIKYEKIITINDESELSMNKCVNILLHLMYSQTPETAYFKLRLTDSQKCPFSKDLILNWCKRKHEKEPHEIA